MKDKNINSTPMGGKRFLLFYLEIMIQKLEILTAEKLDFLK